MSEQDKVVAQCPVCDTSLTWPTASAVKSKGRTFDRRWVPLDVALGAINRGYTCKCGRVLQLVPRTPNIELVATVIAGGG